MPRGRPRKYPPGTAPTGAERRASSRVARVQRGWRIVNIMLPPEAAAALAELRERWGMTADWLAIERALFMARGIEQAMRSVREEICIPGENNA